MPSGQPPAFRIVSAVTPLAPGAQPHYDRRRARGDRHPAALRHLFNRMLGQLYHCLQANETYDRVKAFGPPAEVLERAAA